MINFFFIWLALATIISNDLMRNIENNNTRHILFNYFRWQTVLVTFYISMALLYNPIGRDTTKMPKFLNAFFYSFHFIFMYIVFITSYSWFVYTNLPHSFGGGQLSKISFFVKSEDLSPSLKQFLLRSDAIDGGLNKFDLVKESTESYYLLVSKKPLKIIELPKRMTQGCVISESN